MKVTLSQSEKPTLKFVSAHKNRSDLEAITYYYKTSKKGKNTETLATFIRTKKAIHLILQITSKPSDTLSWIKFLPKLAESFQENKTIIPDKNSTGFVRNLNSIDQSLPVGVTRERRNNDLPKGIRRTPK